MMVLHAPIVSWMKYFRCVVSLTCHLLPSYNGMCLLVTCFIIISSDQVYEARLFRLNKSNNGEVITSVEEAVNLQKKQSALNHFYWNLSREDKSSTLSASDYKDNGNKREMVEKVTVRCCIICFIKSCLALSI